MKGSRPLDGTGGLGEARQLVAAATQLAAGPARRLMHLAAQRPTAPRPATEVSRQVTQDMHPAQLFEFLGWSRPASTTARSDA